VLQFGMTDRGLAGCACSSATTPSPVTLDEARTPVPSRVRSLGRRGHVSVAAPSSQWAEGAPIFATGQSDFDLRNRTNPTKEKR
jgi:hypothetical protein